MCAAHLESLSILEVSAPVWVERVSVRFHFNVSCDGSLGGINQPRHHRTRTLRVRVSKYSEAPLTSAEPVPVSGTAAALTLRRYTSHSVVIVERDAYQHPRVGEIVSSAIFPLLDYLGASECLREGDAVESHANAAAWGSDQLIVRDHMFTGRGSGWHLDRRTFDLSLADAARKAGATMFRNTCIRSASRADDGGWLLSVEGENNTLIHAAHVIDASGRTISFARLAGAAKESVDHLIGVVGYFRGLDGRSTNHSTLVEAEECGWWYGALLPHGTAVVSFMTDAFQAKALCLNEWRGFYERLLETRHISGFLTAADPLEQLYIHSASSHRLCPVIGPRWVAVGDAAASYDPLSSLGIGQH
jgi:flavin-dependent dehydrogenase